MNEIISVFFSPLSLLIAIIASGLTIMDKSGSYWNKFRFKRIDKITRALHCESLDSESKKAIEREYAAESFQLTYGFYAQEEFRKSIISLCENSKGRLFLNKYKYSSHFLSFIDGELKVEMSWRMGIFMFLKACMSAWLLFIGSVVWMLPATAKVNEPVAMILSITMLICAGIQGSAAVSYFDCKKIQKEIERQKDEGILYQSVSLSENQTLT